MHARMPRPHACTHAAPPARPPAPRTHLRLPCGADSLNTSSSRPSGVPSSSTMNMQMDATRNSKSLSTGTSVASPPASCGVGGGGAGGWVGGGWVLGVGRCGVGLGVGGCALACMHSAIVTGRCTHSFKILSNRIQSYPTLSKPTHLVQHGRQPALPHADQRLKPPVVLELLVKALLELLRVGVGGWGHGGGGRGGQGVGPTAGAASGGLSISRRSYVPRFNPTPHAQAPKHPSTLGPKPYAPNPRQSPCTCCILPFMAACFLLDMPSPRLSPRLSIMALGKASPCACLA